MQVISPLSMYHPLCALVVPDVCVPASLFLGFAVYFHHHPGGHLPGPCRVSLIILRQRPTDTADATLFRFLAVLRAMYVVQQP